MPRWKTSPRQAQLVVTKAVEAVVVEVAEVMSEAEAALVAAAVKGPNVPVLMIHRATRWQLSQSQMTS